MCINIGEIKVVYQGCAGDGNCISLLSRGLARLFWDGFAGMLMVGDGGAGEPGRHPRLEAPSLAVGQVAGSVYFCSDAHLTHLDALNTISYRCGSTSWYNTRSLMP